MIKFWLSIAGKKQGTQFQVDAEPLLQVPIITASELIEQKVIAFVDRILELQMQDPTNLIESLKDEIIENVNQIDNLIFLSYEISEREQEIIKKKLDE